MIANEFADARGVLVWHEAAGDFCAGPRGHDGLVAVALIAAGQPVDLERRARTALFHRRVAVFAEQHRNAQQLFQLCIRHREPAALLALLFGERFHILIKTGNLDEAVIVEDLAQQVAQGHRRIFHRAAENAGVQVARRAVQLDFKCNDAAQRIGERGMFRAGHAGVRDDDGVAFQFGTIFFQKDGKVFAADFLLTFNHKSQVAGQGSSGFEIGLDGLQVGEVLALVVGAAARVNGTSLNARLERRRIPQVERLGRLHVVVAVYHEVRRAAPATITVRRLGNDDGMAGGRADFRFESDGAAMGDEPFGAGAKIFFVLRLRGDACEAEVIAQFGHEARLVLFQVIKNDLHGHS